MKRKGGPQRRQQAIQRRRTTTFTTPSGRRPFIGPQRKMGIPPPELKFFDGNLTVNNIGTGGTVFTPAVCTPIRGTAGTQRVGIKCNLMKLFIQGRIIKLPSSADLADDIVRIIVFLDRQCNGVAATITELLDTADIFSYRNLSNAKRFKFYHDKLYDMNSMGGYLATLGACITQTQSFKIAVSVNEELDFTGTTGSIADLNSNNVGIAVISANNVESTIQYNYRCRFYG